MHKQEKIYFFTELGTGAQVPAVRLWFLRDKEGDKEKELRERIWIWFSLLCGSEVGCFWQILTFSIMIQTTISPTLPYLSSDHYKWMPVSFPPCVAILNIQFNLKWHCAYAT